MLAVATTRVDVLRGTSVDEYLDEIDGDDKVLAIEAVPASIIEQTKQVSDSVSGAPRVIRFHICRIAHGLDIRITDRIRDRETREVYAIESMTTPKSPTNKGDLRLDLVRVD